MRVKITWDATTLDRFRRRLDAFKDAEASTVDEYALDLYDEEPPMAFELLLLKDGVDVLAAAELQYDATLDGYYLGARRFDIENLEQVLLRFLAGEPA
jgi:hypothetical protein